MTISSSKKSTDSPWYKLFLEINKLSILSTPNQPLKRNKELANSIEHFFEN